ncbi:hypothetical protein [Acidipropionibacterium jensenii]|uniref:hypothetical protein n=1 Tax=Acidipropionibacterium jensenii TaxID=1749 RepID=UPI0026486E07|nr:hypothetical protein [Acidipropionibacterium jensenii]MDN6428065.1 hypothetical protein [Acidipropionibacterium jensenii]
MTGDPPIDQTTLNLMEVYRQQVTNLTTRTANAEQEADGARYSQQCAERAQKEAKREADRFRQKWLEEETKTKKLQGIIDTLKIELQDARADATEAKEHHEENQ